MNPPATPVDSLVTLRVWDLPTRVFHWLLVVLMLGLVVTGQLGGAWMEWHARCGYGVLTLLLFRLGWGVFGGHHARFARFVPGPAALCQWLSRLGRGPHVPAIGHNPLGALSVIAMLLVLSLQALSGLVSDDEIAFTGPLSAQVSSSVVGLATWYHKSVGKPLLIGLVILHLLAMIYYRRRHGERLIEAMLTGDKTLPSEQIAGAPDSRDGLRDRLLALVWLVCCAGLVAALVLWGSAA
jgi:cytochrome b